MTRKSQAPEPVKSVQGVNETFDGEPVEGEQLDAPELTRGGKLKQAWTDDATGKTYLPGETLEGDDGD